MYSPQITPPPKKKINLFPETPIVFLCNFNPQKIKVYIQVWHGQYKEAIVLFILF